MTGLRFSSRVTAVVIALFAAGYLALAFQLPDFVGVNVPVQTATLPRLLGIVLLLLAASLFFQRDARSTEPQGETKGETQGDGAERAPGTTAPPARLGRLSDPRMEVGLFVLSMCAYVALFETAGFVLSTAAYIGAVTWYLGYRRHLVTALVSVGIAVGVYLGMSYGLDVMLPAGPLPL
jgi:putative tricarboxylic transport membrane protein